MRAKHAGDLQEQSRFIDLGAGRFHYLEYGDPSQRPLVFLHGIFSCAADYDELLRSLARTRHVIAPDQRGHGQSVRAAEYSWAGLAADLESFATALDLDTFDLVGYSLGAFVAVLYAGARPASVERLVLIEGGLEPPDAPAAPEFWGKVARVLLPPEGHRSPEAFIDAASTEFPRASRSALTIAAKRLIQRPDGRWERPRVDLKVGALAGQRDSEGHARMVAAIKSPTLVLRAQHSELFVADGYRELAGTLKRAHVEFIPNSGHLFVWENVDEATDRIAHFLERDEE